MIIIYKVNGFICMDVIMYKLLCNRIKDIINMIFISILLKLYYDFRYKL